MSTAARTVTYTNPVHPRYFADPFILKTGGTYYAYGTDGPTPSGVRHFPVLRSIDLAHWEFAGHALVPLQDPPALAYWAPEVAEHDGRFLLFYSASTTKSDLNHRLRLATSNAPAGPFIDSGRPLMPDAGFSIDAHPFRDPRTGRWYLFFAADYVADEPYGTGLAVVPLGDDLMRVTGEPRVVIRGSCPWQVYQHNRNYRGRVWPAWHCVEGPFVLYHEGRYWCLYSGGGWYGENYGVGFAVADDPLGPWTDDFAAHGPTVLKGVAGKVIGPGHCSVVTGPDDRTPFLVYHAWDVAHTARRLCVDPLFWTADGPRCDGPSFEPREIRV